MIWALIVLCGLVGVGLMGVSGMRLRVLLLNRPSALSPPKMPQDSLQRQSITSDIGAQPNTGVDNIWPELIDEPALLLTPSNSLAAPTNHLEAEYVQWLSDDEKRGRTVTADEAFWADSFDVVYLWAKENKYEPGTDWGVILSGSLSLEDLINLAGQQDIAPDWDEYFIGSAYIRVGDIKKDAERSADHANIDAALRQIHPQISNPNGKIAAWAGHAVAFLSEEAADPAVRALFTWPLA